MRNISQSHGRISLTLSGHRIGPDYAVTLTGGKAHIGACALAEPETPARIIETTGHREGELAGILAARLASLLGSKVALTCGIHYDQITKEEIRAVYAIAIALANRLALEETNMGTLEDLDKLEQNLKSGLIEDQFKYGTEEDRLAILELLEKVMDVADLANEVATKLLMPNIAGKSAPKD